MNFRPARDLSRDYRFGETTMFYIRGTPMPRDMVTEHLVEVHRSPTRVDGDPRRVMMRFFWPGADRGRRIVQQLTSMPEDVVRRQINEIFLRFGSRHADLEGLLMQSAEETARRLQIDLGDDRARQLLLAHA